MMRWFALLLLLVVLMLAAACGGGGSAELTATPTELAIPSDFTTYTDEQQLFRISYPSDWEVELSLIPELRELVEEAFTSLEDASMIFFAGVPPEEGAHGSVSIIVEPGGDFSTLEQAAEVSVRTVKEFALEFNLFEQTQAVVGGKEAAIFDSEMAFSDIPPSRVLTMLVLDGKVLWTASCGSSPEKFPSIKETCNQVVRSLRILR